MFLWRILTNTVVYHQAMIGSWAATAIEFTR